MIRINLALQGGGAHGAFTWGVLDRLLQEPGIGIAAISGTSAGALNAAALKVGLLRGGPEGARENLAWLWGEIGALSGDAWSAWMRLAAPSVPALATMLEYSPGWIALDAATRMGSPYLLAGFLRNPLERLVARMHFDDVCANAEPELHVCATNVRTGRIRVFAGAEIDAQVLLASACLPTLFPAVEIDDPATGRREAYWDGGYAGNPALFPLYPPHLPDDIVIVSVNPQHRDTLPMDSAQIQNRINEISFNASLLADLRAAAFVKRLIAQGKVARGAMKDVRLHMISDDDLMNDLNVATKTVPVALILDRLRAAGEAAADGFLSRHRGDLGQRGTVDLAAMLG